MLVLGLTCFVPPHFLFFLDPLSTVPSSSTAHCIMITMSFLLTCDRTRDFCAHHAHSSFLLVPLPPLPLGSKVGLVTWAFRYMKLLLEAPFHVLISSSASIVLISDVGVPLSEPLSRCIFCSFQLFLHCAQSSNWYIRWVIAS